MREDKYVVEMRDGDGWTELDRFVGQDGAFELLRQVIDDEDNPIPVEDVRLVWYPAK